MGVRTGTLAGAAYPADDLPAFDLFPRLDLYPEHMPIQGAIAIAVVDHDVVAIAVTRIAGHFHRSVRRCIDRRALGGGKIEPGVKLGGLVDGVDTISKTGGDAVEVLVADGLNGRSTGQELFLVLDKTVDLYIGLALIGHPGGELVEGGCDGHI